MTGAPSCGKKGHYKRGRHSAGKRGESITPKSLYSNLPKHKNIIHNLKTTKSPSSVHTSLDELSPKSIPCGSL
jgi:hypothetical protein